MIQSTAPDSACACTLKPTSTAPAGVSRTALAASTRLKRVRPVGQRETVGYKAKNRVGWRVDGDGLNIEWLHAQLLTAAVEPASVLTTIARHSVR